MLRKIKDYVLPTVVVLGLIAYFGITLHYLGKATVEVRKTIYHNLNVPLE